MVVLYSRSIAYCCSQCGAMSIGDIHLFDLPDAHTQTFLCKCDTQCVHITPKKDQYKIHASCPHCLERHSFSIRKKAFWNKEINTFFCPSTNVGVFSIGIKPLVEEYIQEQEDAFEELFEDMNFENNTILMTTLDRIQEISGDGNVFCTCGSVDIAFDINLDSVYLICEQCDSTEMISAACEQDLIDIASREYIVIKCSNPLLSPDNPVDNN